MKRLIIRFVVYLLALVISVFVIGICHELITRYTSIVWRPKALVFGDMSFDPFPPLVFSAFALTCIIIYGFHRGITYVEDRDQITFLEFENAKYAKDLEDVRQEAVRQRQAQARQIESWREWRRSVNMHDDWCLHLREQAEKQARFDAERQRRREQAEIARVALEEAEAARKAQEEKEMRQRTLTVRPKLKKLELR